jgi:hypothetical protein
VACGSFPSLSVVGAARFFSGSGMKWEEMDAEMDAE